MTIIASASKTVRMSDNAIRTVVDEDAKFFRNMFWLIDENGDKSNLLTACGKLFMYLLEHDVKTFSPQAMGLYRDLLGTLHGRLGRAYPESGLAMDDDVEVEG